MVEAGVPVDRDGEEELHDSLDVSGVRDLISECGYYAWRKRKPSQRSRDNEKLLAEIRSIWIESRCSYGAPRIAAQLGRNGRTVSKKRVARSMRNAGLSTSLPQKHVCSTRRSSRAHGIIDRVNRQFKVSELDQLWLADATYLPTLDGMLYLATLQDACSRRIFGWSLKTSQTAELMSEVLRMALRGRSFKGVIHHSDQGSQYSSKAFQSLCEGHGIKQSMGSVGDCYDNAQAESWFVTLKRENVLKTDALKSAKKMRQQVIRYIESWYNTRCLYTSLG